MSTLFERIGGTAAIDAAVDTFYEKVLADDRIMRFFNDVDMNQQSRHQKRFFAYAFGGMPDYPGRSLRNAHQSLVKNRGLNDTHFDAVMEHLGSTLKELGVSVDLITEAAKIAESTRDDILNREA